jgi:aryl-alcohol dehydrogenase-like predicted oxidoreductase
LTVPRRRLGRSGLSLPVIGFGCGPTAALIASGVGDSQYEAVARALELGIDFFDTAPLYGNGRSEQALGQILRELGATPDIATKVLLSHDDLSNIDDAITRSVETSCERLGRSQLTLLFLHNRIAAKRVPQTGNSVGPLLSLDDMLGPGGVAEVFGRLRDRGIVRHVGCSAYGGEMQAVAGVIDSGMFDCLSVHHSLLNPTAWTRSRFVANEHDYARIAARAAEAGMGVIALRVFEAGVLVGGKPASETVEAQLKALSELLANQRSVADAALRFVLSEKAVTTALVGFSSPAHVEAAAKSAVEGALAEPLLTRIATWQSDPLRQILN